MPEICRLIRRSNEDLRIYSVGLFLLPKGADRWGNTAKQSQGIRNLRFDFHSKNSKRRIYKCQKLISLWTTELTTQKDTGRYSVQAERYLVLIRSLSEYGTDKDENNAYSSFRNRQNIHYYVLDGKRTSCSLWLSERTAYSSSLWVNSTVIHSCDG